MRLPENRGAAAGCAGPAVGWRAALAALADGGTGGRRGGVAAVAALEISATGGQRSNQSKDFH